MRPNLPVRKRHRIFVYALLHRSLSYREIAKIFGVSHPTVMRIWKEETNQLTPLYDGRNPEPLSIVKELLTEEPEPITNTYNEFISDDIPF